MHHSSHRKLSHHHCSHHKFRSHHHCSYHKLSNLIGKFEILGVVSKQLRLHNGRVRDSTTFVNCLCPTMKLLVKDTVASCVGDTVGHFRPIRNEFQNLSSSILNFSVLTLSISLSYLGRELSKRSPNAVIVFS